MALKWSNTSQAGTAQGLKVLVWGESGMGKTTLAGTLPEHNSVILSAEAGLLSIRNRNINVIEITSVEDLTEAHAWLQTPAAAAIENVALDSVTEIAEVVLANAKRQTKDPRQAYGELIDKMTMVLKSFRDLKGKNVVFLAKSEYTKDEVSGVGRFGPSMPGSKLGPQMPYLFDEVFKIAVGVDPNTKEKFRYLQTEADLQNVCKDRSGALAPLEPANLPHIFGKILATVPNHTQTTQQ